MWQPLTASMSVNIQIIVHSAMQPATPFSAVCILKSYTKYNTDHIL